MEKEALVKFLMEEVLPAHDRAAVVDGVKQEEFTEANERVINQNIMELTRETERVLFGSKKDRRGLVWLDKRYEEKVCRYYIPTNSARPE